VVQAFRLAIETNNETDLEQLFRDGSVARQQALGEDR
jgi:hypothetical protein